MRVVLDTNIIVSGVFWGGRPLALLRAWAKGSVTVVGSPSILWEYERVLIEVARNRISQDLENWLTFIHNRLELVQPERELKICRDPMDDMFLSCAAAARVTYILSGDKDLLILNEIEGIPILNLANFLNRHQELIK